MVSVRHTSLLVLACAVIAGLGGCKKKTPTPPPPPAGTKAAPSGPKPVINSFTVELPTIEKGQSCSIKWSVSDAKKISIEPGLGLVQPNGNRQVFPEKTTTYKLTATNDFGDTTASATCSVTVPPPPPVQPVKPSRSLSERLNSDVLDALFDYDSADIREDARSVLTRNAEALKAIFRDFPQAAVIVEGHCDERGSAEYNLALGDRRAVAAKEFLSNLGVTNDKLKTVTYGKERPQCSDENEDCYQRNRRAHFAPAQ